MDILLIDHSAADAYLTKLALNEAFLDSRVCVAEDGEQALQYLAETENYPAAMHPDLILLDLNIPRLDGLSLLTLIKLFPHYRSTPIIVLTTSSWSRDIERAFQLGALKYFIKPTNCEDHIALGAAIAAVWDQRFAKSKGADGQISH